jgi:hypothetical protein
MTLWISCCILQGGWVHPQHLIHSEWQLARFPAGKDPWQYDSAHTDQACPSISSHALLFIYQHLMQDVVYSCTSCFFCCRHDSIPFLRRELLLQYVCTITIHGQHMMIQKDSLSPPENVKSVSTAKYGVSVVDMSTYRIHSLSKSSSENSGMTSFFASVASGNRGSVCTMKCNGSALEFPAFWRNWMISRLSGSNHQWPYSKQYNTTNLYPEQPRIYSQEAWACSRLFAAHHSLWWIPIV